MVVELKSSLKIIKRLLVFVFAVALLGSCDSGVKDKYTSIPDKNFEQALIELGYDDVIDGKILKSNISVVDTLYVNGKGILDLSGIEDFTALRRLECAVNKLTNLDVSNNIVLGDLDCRINNLKSLDLGKNTALRWLGCNDNNLTSLDVSQNTGLKHIYCDENQLKCLDVSQNTALNSLDCKFNPIKYLNLKNRNNENLYQFEVDNKNLTCLIVDDPAWAKHNWIHIDSGVIFSTNCNYPAGCF